MKRIRAVLLPWRRTFWAESDGDCKACPRCSDGEALSIHYSRDNSMPNDVEEWLKANEVMD